MRTDAFGGLCDVGRSWRGPSGTQGGDKAVRGGGWVAVQKAAAGPFPSERGLPRDFSPGVGLCRCTGTDSGQGEVQLSAPWAVPRREHGAGQSPSPVPLIHCFLLLEALTTVF